MSTRRNFISFVSTLGAMAALPQTESQATAKKPQKIKVGQIGSAAPVWCLKGDSALW